MRRVASLMSMLALASGSLGRARAEEAAEDPLKGLSGQAALEIAIALSADKMKGRKTGFEGGRLADDYVAQAMAEMGLDPKDPDGAYLDAFEFTATQVKAPIALAMDGKPLAYGTEYLEAAGTAAGKGEGELVFVGYGIVSKDLDDYGPADVRGKVVVALDGTPDALEVGGRPKSSTRPANASSSAKAASAHAKGAKALLLVQQEVLRSEFVGGPSPAALPVLCLSSGAAERLLTASGTSLDAERTKRAATPAGVLGGARLSPPGPVPPVPLKAKATFEVNVEVRAKAKGHNALGAIPGRDPDLRGEVVLVGANMDSLGLDAEGRVYNGADDNASGTAVLLHVAKTLIDSGWRPKRTVLFVAFGGGAAGDAGARHLAEGLPFEHDGVVCALAVERVGQAAGVLLFGGEGQSEETITRLVQYTQGPAYGSHAPFGSKGVPAFLLTTPPVLANVGTVGDDADTLKPDGLGAAARSLGSLVVRLGEDPTPLKSR
jgi:aminopeptidase YwaD